MHTRHVCVCETTGAWSEAFPALNHHRRTNLHADILSDLAAALAGSLGIAPNRQHWTPEIALSRHVRSPFHGAPSTSREGIANPVGGVCGPVHWMLEHLGEKDAAHQLMKPWNE